MSKLKAVLISLLTYLAVLTIIQASLPGNNCPPVSLCAPPTLYIIKNLVSVALLPLILIILPIVIIKYDKKLPKKNNKE